MVYYNTWQIVMSKRISFELFPPRTVAGREKIAAVQQTLAAFHPDFFSVTYGAGGSTRDGTRDIVRQLCNIGCTVAPHMSRSANDTDDDCCILLDEYKAQGIQRIVALRGDDAGNGSQTVSASALTEFIRQNYGDHFHMEIAAYPELHPNTQGYDNEITHLKSKFAAGAHSAITQYFYNTDAYLYFIEECQQQGIEQPIYPGIMPISNVENLLRFSQKCCAEIPRWLRYRLQCYQDPESLQSFSTDFITDQCERLLHNGAPGLHFYTLNKAEPVASICRQLKLNSANT